MPSQSANPVGWEEIHDAHCDRKYVVVEQHPSGTTRGYVTRIDEDGFHIVTSGLGQPGVKWSNVKSVMVIA